MILQPNLQQKQIDWPSLYFYAEAAREPFCEVSIKTLRSEFVEQAAAQLVQHSKKISANKIALQTAKMISSGKADAVRQYVDISSNGIVVCINAVEITDDVLWQALDMLASALEQLEGKTGRIYFGEKIIFLPTEIPWLYQH